MRVEMNYGRGTLPVDLPDDWDVTIIQKQNMPIIADGQAAVARALANPLGSKTLAEEAKGRKTVCILICDITRPVPNGTILPVLVRELLNGGIEAQDIQILVATGMHRPNEGDELRELVGDDWVFENIRVDNHFGDRDEDHVLVGTTTYGIPVKLDRRFVEADMRIATGLVEPHFMAGYSGGRKVIAPGVAHADTITMFHTATFNHHPKAENCNLDGNPLHRQQLEIVRLVGGALSVNTVIDDERNLSFVSFGEIEESHMAAVDYVRQYAEVPVAERFNTILTSAAGYPLDKTYYQTVKGMVSPIDILIPGGDLVIVSDCSEGMGSDAYVTAQKRLLELGPDAFMAELWPKTHAPVDEWQTEMQLKATQVGAVHLYTEGLPEADRDLTGVNIIDSVIDTLRASVERFDDARVGVIPEGPYLVPFYRP